MIEADDAFSKKAADKKAAAEKAEADKADELQAACRATWTAYVDAYAARYSTPPVRNAKVNSNVKEFVKRIGYDESPAVAAFFVKSISEALVLRSCHPVGLLLQNAEAYRTQWATGRTAEILTTPAETTYQRSMRERMAEFAPGIARKAPGEAQKMPQTPVEFFQAIEVEALRIA